MQELGDKIINQYLDIDISTIHRNDCWLAFLVYCSTDQTKNFTTPSHTQLYTDRLISRDVAPIKSTLRHCCAQLFTHPVHTPFEQPTGVQYLAQGHRDVRMEPPTLLLLLLFFTTQQSGKRKASGWGG